MFDRRGVAVVGWPKLGSCSGLFARLPLFFHRLFEAEAFAIHLEDMAMVGESIQQGCGHAFALEDLIPVAEGQVAGNQQAAAFVSIGKDLEEQFGSRATE